MHRIDNHLQDSLQQCHERRRKTQLQFTQKVKQLKDEYETKYLELLKAYKLDHREAKAVLNGVVAPPAVAEIAGNHAPGAGHAVHAVHHEHGPHSGPMPSLDHHDGVGELDGGPGA